MLEFSTHYPYTKCIVLEENYRSHQAILDVASHFIKNNNAKMTFLN